LVATTISEDEGKKNLKTEEGKNKQEGGVFHGKLKKGMSCKGLCGYMFLLETWLKCDAPAVLIEMAPSVCDFPYSFRRDKRGGGLATIASKAL